MAMLALVGPTASGKSEAALALAPRLGAEIVSVDSMLVYRVMDVGTAKPTVEQRAAVPHHLLDLAEPSERFTVARFRELARSALRSVARPLLVGGSGLYLRAVVDDLAFPPEDRVVRASLEAEADDLGADALYHRLAEMDPVAAARIEPGNVRRIIRALEVTAISGAPFSSFATTWDRYDADRLRAAGIRMDRDVQKIRIGERVLAMLRNGWLDEVGVRGLRDRWVRPGGDGVIGVWPGAGAPFRSDLTTAEGPPAEMSGKGVRCVAASLGERGRLAVDDVEVETPAGIRHVTVH